MQFLIGAALAVFLFSCIGISYLLGYNQGRTSKNAKAVPFDEQEQKKIERLNKEFEILSGYNLNKALDRKVMK